MTYDERSKPQRIDRALGPLPTRVRLLAVLLAVATVGGECGDVPPEGDPSDPLPDCLPYGPRLCGPDWDSDDDLFSTRIETNPTNRWPTGYYELDTLVWDTYTGLAQGTPTLGSILDGLNLRDTGTGYAHHLGSDFVDTDDWGTRHLVNLIEGSGRLWQTRGVQWGEAVMQVGDMSRRGGGSFQPDHTSHQNGLDVDIRYLRWDGPGSLNICLSPSLYDVDATIGLINSFILAEEVDGAGRLQVIGIDEPCAGIAPNPLLQHWNDHEDHFHVRIEDPDGTYN